MLGQRKKSANLSENSCPVNWPSKRSQRGSIRTKNLTKRILIKVPLSNDHLSSKGRSLPCIIEGGVKVAWRNSARGFEWQDIV